MNSLDLYYNVKKKDIAYICNYFEAFEGIAALRNPNPDKYSDVTMVHLMVAPDFMEQFNIMIKDLKNNVFIEKTQK